MSISDLIKGSVLESFSNNSLGTKEILVTFAIAFLMSVYVFFCYRFLIRRSLYSRTFNISLIALTLITTAVIITIQSSFVVSLGMVGALSIVRFRTAIKDAMDLVFLFWSISIGIMCGAGLFELTVISSLVITFAIAVFDRIPVGTASMILIVDYKSSNEADAEVMQIIKEKTGYYKIKSRSVSNGQVNLVCEIRAESDMELTNSLSALESVYSSSVLSHDGEATF